MGDIHANTDHELGKLAASIATMICPPAGRIVTLRLCSGVRCVAKLLKFLILLNNIEG